MITAVTVDNDIFQLNSMAALADDAFKRLFQKDRAVIVGCNNGKTYDIHLSERLHVAPEFQIEKRQPSSFPVLCP